MIESHQYTAVQPENPFEITYPPKIRHIIEKLDRREELTYKEASDAVKVLRHIFVDISKLLEQAHNEMGHALMPVIAAADYLKQITDAREEQFDGIEG
jgi:hypothetical protein